MKVLKLNIETTDASHLSLQMTVLLHIMKKIYPVHSLLISTILPTTEIIWGLFY